MANKDLDPRTFSIATATRSELYAARRKPWFQQVLRNEVTSKGFWQPSNNEKEDEEKLKKINEELSEVYAQLDMLQDEEAQQKALQRAKAEHKRRHEKRLMDSKANRTIRKLQRLKAKRERAAEWQEKTKDRIVFCSEQDVWSWTKRTTDTKRLEQQGLPLVYDELQLCKLLNSNIAQLRLLSYSAKLSKTFHYHNFSVPKKSGGKRTISAPSPALKAVQKQILEKILTPLSLHEAAHGFVTSRSIASNAAPHIGAQIVINMDLKDFFPSISYRRVRGVFHRLGYSESISMILAHLCTEARVHTIDDNGEKWFLRVGEHALPQGAPTSPAISNLVCRRLDARMEGLANKQGFRYTRYADDLTFSSHNKDASVGALLSAVRKIVAAEDFVVHPKKTRVMRRGSCQEVTGVVVNEKSNVSKKRLKKFRAFLHNLEQNGLGKASWEDSRDTLAAAEGFASFVYMVKGEDGKQLLAETKRIVAAARTQKIKNSEK